MMTQSRTNGDSMSGIMNHNSYGKSRVRVSKIIRQGDRHDFKEFSVDIQLEGDFAASYTDGDNVKIVATDSMKNTVYALAAQHPLTDIESFAKTLSEHFLKKYSHVKSTRVTITEDLWVRIPVDGKPHPHSFVSGGNEKRMCTVEANGDKRIVSAGISDLLVLKTTASEFWGFIRDEYTTLPEVKDRIFATSIMAQWTYKSDNADFNGVHDKVRNLLLSIFAHHHSLAVQQTEYEMGQAILKACPEITEVTITMPNQHRIPFDLTRLGLKNANEIFVPTDEPYGLIAASFKRK